MDATTMLRNLERATNEHDLAALADCFAEDYRNETPLHPARSFRGREQVRANWRQIFAGGARRSRTGIAFDHGRRDRLE